MKVLLPKGQSTFDGSCKQSGIRQARNWYSQGDSIDRCEEAVKRLSHYTNTAGLRGIATSGTLWATNFMTVEDRSELFHGWRIVQLAALRYVRERLPTDVFADIADPDGDQLEELFRNELNASGGYGHLYMTSFIRHETDDDEERGSLTHWRHFAGNGTGYCLQYDSADIERMIQMEGWKSTYGLLELAPVTYGVDETTWEFRQLVQQLGELQLLAILKQTRDPRVPVDYGVYWAPSAVARKLMRFCATHKDRTFRDEREIRILAFPENETVVRPLTGLAIPKTIEPRDGRRILSLGANWKPGISPKRIIVGPRADPHIDDTVIAFSHRPEIVTARIPV